MREILFRGKRMNPSINEWIYGHVRTYKKNGLLGASILKDNVEDVLIYIETLGQYTGIDDKNGVKVFEGDLLKFDWIHGEKYIGEVVWDSEYACFDILPHFKDINTYFGVMGSNEYEVIGNKFDNPELLEA